MSTKLSDLCEHFRKCAEKIEEQIKVNINDCHNMVYSKESTDVKVALEKAKDYHYKEIINLLSNILTSIKQIVFHASKIRHLSQQENMSEDELKRYSYVQRQVNIFDGAREKRRVASEISLHTLEAWEKYQENKEKEDLFSYPANIIYNTIPRREKQATKRKKIISSTFGNFLDLSPKSPNLEFISEDDKNSNYDADDQYLSCEDLLSDIDRDEEVHEIASESSENLACSNSLSGSSMRLHDATDGSDIEEEASSNHEKSCEDFSLVKLINSLSEEHLEPIDTKPKIVDVVYKKTPVPD